MNGKGAVISIHIAPAARAPMQSVAKVKAITGQGLEDDRYCNRVGTFSGQPGTGREITLIEIEAIEALKRDYQVELEAGLTRRNFVTRGVPLNHLVNRQFKIGAVTLRGIRLCEPCSHMEKLTRPGVVRGLVHRGGLRADIVAGGTIRVGDIITFDGVR
ncbi:MAG TPA: MOSC domain-containing protein [Candidatus Binatia bacterium]